MKRGLEKGRCFLKIVKRPLCSCIEDLPRKGIFMYNGRRGAEEIGGGGLMVEFKKRFKCL